MPPIRVAVVGCGAWGRNVVRNFAELGALGAICDHHAEVTADLSRRYDVPAREFDDILTDEAIDAVAVVTQPAHHAAIALASLKAGKHVFVEKPLAETLAQADSITAAAREARRILMVGHLLRYHPAFVALQRLVETGAIGSVRHIRAHRFNFGAIRREEDVLACLAPHDISMVLALLGADPDTVESRLAHPLGRPIADMASIALGFPDGVRADISVSWLHPEKEQRLVVTCETAIAVFDDLQPWDSKLTLTRLQRPQDGSGPPQRMESEAVPLVPGEPLSIQCRCFLDAIANDRPPLTDGSEALRVMRVLESAGRVRRSQNSVM